MGRRLLLQYTAADLSTKLLRRSGPQDQDPRRSDAYGDWYLVRLLTGTVPTRDDLHFVNTYTCTSVVHVQTSIHRPRQASCH